MGLVGNMPPRAKPSVFTPPTLGDPLRYIAWPLFFMEVALVRFQLARHPVYRAVALRIVAGGLA